MFGWLIHERGIEPHIPAFGKSDRLDGKNHQGDVYFCPGGRMLTCKYTIVADNQLIHRAT